MNCTKMYFHFGSSIVTTRSMEVGTLVQIRTVSATILANSYGSMVDNCGSILVCVLRCQKTRCLICLITKLILKRCLNLLSNLLILSSLMVSMRLDQHTSHWMKRESHIHFNAKCFLYASFVWALQPCLLMRLYQRHLNIDKKQKVYQI